MRAVLLLTISLITACAGGGQGINAKLLGEWRYADAKQSCEYTFKKDGTFNGKVTYEGRILSRFHGKWSVRKGALFSEYTGDVLGQIPIGTKDKDTLLALEPDYFLIRVADGSERRYIRQK